MESLLVATELGIYRIKQIKTYGRHSTKSEDPVFKISKSFAMVNRVMFTWGVRIKRVMSGWL